MQVDESETSTNIEKIEAASESHNGYLCPKCHSDNTQKLEMAFLSGRFKRTPLEAAIRPPRDPELIPDWFYWLSGISGTVFVWWYYKLFNGMPWSPDFIDWFLRADLWQKIVVAAKVMGIFVASVLLSLWVFYNNLKKRKSARENSQEYLEAKKTWKHGYICHKCGHRYLIHTNW